MNDATAQFRRLAEESIDAALEADPVGATWLGDHRFDDRLPDYSIEARASRSRQIDDQLTAIDAIDDVELDVVDLVDLEILRSRLQREAFEIDELTSAEWNPMEWNPGTALHLLLSRDFAPWPERLASIQSRLSAIPEFLDTARRSLDSMPHIHVETAVGQLTGTRAVVTDAIAEQCVVNETDLPAGVD
ncbi:MAG: DUF885 domain-containing protein, partial [Actinomycetia bacterium]|nr:DUF885 domain-containing protein [Actinomycetes bacterium]